MPESHRSPRPVVLALLLALPFVAVATSLAAAGDPPPPLPSPSPGGDPSRVPPPQPGGTTVDPAAAQREAVGAHYFDEAVAYVARGGALGKTRDLYAHLDASWDLPDMHYEGLETVWYVASDRMRNQRDFGGQTSTKILNGDRAWAISTDGVVHRLHATPEAERTLAQLKEDLVRVRDLTDFLTLEGMKSAGVRFEFVGAVQGSGAYAGDWLKIFRHSPDGRRMTFWLAHEKDAQGLDHATWPGVVRVEGDAKANLYTEDWILRDWDAPSSERRAFRYPFKIEAYRFPADPEKAKVERPTKFLKAFVDDIQVNAGVDAARFEPPQTPAGR